MMVPTPQTEEGNVTVVVRVRPQNLREQEGNRQSTINVLDNSLLVFDPEESSLLGISVGFQPHDSVSRKKGKNMMFAFDRVFGERVTQAEVFENTTKEILDDVLNGYNCSVFAYGATGAGKTYTMLGSEREPGIMYLTMEELYMKMEARKEKQHCEVFISYQEVYNEQIHDLLEPKGPMTIREDPEKGVLVQGLSFHRPKSASQVLDMLRKGNQNRTQHPTDINATSSRSHAIFQIYVKQQDCVVGMCQNQLVAKMSLIDLAGSERASAANTTGERLREGASINRSLLALINVINSLADAKSKKPYIPYRDSKLTRLLKDSLGGNCRTVMIAAISPSALSYEDTYNTLKYANRAKEIKLFIKPNVVSLNYSISQYAATCEQLKAEVADLRGRLQAYEEKIPEFNPSPLLAPSSPEQRSRETDLDKAVLQKDDRIAKAPLQLLKLNSSRKSNTEEIQDSGKKSGCCCLELSDPEKLRAQLQDMDKHQLVKLVATTLLVAQRQYNQLKSANFLTPEMVVQFEELAFLPYQESIKALKISPLDGQDEERDVQQVTEAVLASSLPATKWASPKISPGSQPSEPDAVFKTPCHSTKKRRKAIENASQSEKSIPSSQRGRVKRRRKACLLSQPVGSLKECSDFAQVDCTSTPLGKKAKALRPLNQHIPPYCPSTVTKGHMPLASSTTQNCCPPRSLNTTFDLFEEPCPPVEKLNTLECPAWESIQHVSNHQGVPLIPRASMPVFTMKGTSIPRASSMASKAPVQKRRHTTNSASHLQSSRIARLQGRSGKLSQVVNAPGRPSGIPAWKWR